MEELRNKLNELTRIAQDSGFRQYKDKTWYHPENLKIYELHNGISKYFYFGESKDDVLEMHLEHICDKYDWYDELHKVEEERKMFEKYPDRYYIEEHIPIKGLFRTY